MQGWDFWRQPDVLPEHEDDDPGPASDNEGYHVYGCFCVTIWAQIMEKGWLSPSSSRSPLRKKSQEENRFAAERHGEESIWTVMWME